MAFGNVGVPKFPDELIVACKLGSAGIPKAAFVLNASPVAVPESAARIVSFAPAVNTAGVALADPTTTSPLAAIVDFGIFVVFELSKASLTDFPVAASVVLVLEMLSVS
jgi:hypothetical protein